MDFRLIRKERMEKLAAKIHRILIALRTYRYTKAADYLDDFAALETFQKELDIQRAYSQLESNLH